MVSQTRRSRWGEWERGYGSEWHLERYRQAFPYLLDEKIGAAIGRPDAELAWLYPASTVFTREPRGMEFLRQGPTHLETLEAWRTFWPQTGNPPNWDGVAREPGSGEWLLFEAEPNHPEFCSHACSAGPKARTLIESAMSQVKVHLGVHRDFQWLGTYHQYANRLACLYFLNVLHKIPTRLIFIYFTGDKFPDGRCCPSNKAEWRRLIEACHLTLAFVRTTL